MINEAYRVLGSDARRAAYDLRLESVDVPYDGERWVESSVSSPASATARPAPGPPARMPWKLMGGMAVIGIAVVLIGAALRKPATERPPDGVVGPGSCVAIESNNDAREVNCRGDGDLVIEVVVAFDSTCPSGTEPHRDYQGLGIACVIPNTVP
jgi:curved DNA-binding protein CbpA